MAYQKGNPRRAGGAASRTRRDANSARLSSDLEMQSGHATSPSHAPVRRSASTDSSGMTTAARIGGRARANSAVYAAVRKKRRHKRILIGVLSTLLVVILGCAGVAFAYFGSINNNLQSGVDDELLSALAATDTPSDPFYTLLLGIDSSADREGSEEFGDNFRSDSMMLVRIDPQNKKATLVSIPRDTMIEDMGGYGTQKINAAHFFGGPPLAVKTVSELAGVPISHYAEINFDGFREVVDTLGGIEVDVPIEIDDPEAGGYLAPGKQILNGDQALILCRSRHAYDDYGAGDLYRAANQRVVLSAIASKLLSSDPMTIANTVAALSENVMTDLGVQSIIAIAQSMQGMSMADIYTGSCPTESEYINDVAYEVVDEDAWDLMMSRVDSGLPPTKTDEVDEATGTVMATGGDGSTSSSAQTATNKAYHRNAEISVRNGNGHEGVCAEAEAVLNSMGYKQINSGNADSFTYTTTVIVYKEAGFEADAEAISKEFGVGKVMEDDQTYLFDSDILIVIGSDWK